MKTDIDIKRTVAAAAKLKQDIKPVDSKQELLDKVFKPHVEWTRHDYDTHDGLYEQLCPTGGPGGLACCAFCSTAYSRFLNQTSRDLEGQSIHNAGKEVEECMEFMGDTRDVLEKKMQVARTQPPPLRRDVAVASTAVSLSLSGIPTESV